MKSVVSAMPAFAFRGALTWGCIGFLGTAILVGVCQSLESPDAQEIASAMSRTVLMRSGFLLAIGGAISGVVYVLLLTFHWHGGERFRGSVDGFVGRTQTVAEIFSFRPILVCSTIVGAVALLISIPTSSFNAMATIAFFGGLMGLGGGAAIPALSIGIVDRF